MVPTVEGVAAVHGEELKAGPRVRYSGPLKRPSAVCAPLDITSQTPWLLVSYVKSVAKSVVPWCVRLTPQPGSFGFHQRSWKLFAALRSNMDQVQVGGVPNTWRVIVFMTCVPLNV